ncbi:MAG: OsmC family protein [Lysobacter sp.]|nr:OsmC family protein [Lysobacter sp.]
MNSPAPAAPAQEHIKIRLTQIADFSFNVSFEETDAPDLITDEPAPLGKGEGPNPSRMLLTAVANCLAASLLFALRKFKNQPTRIDAEVRGTLGRNEEGRLRVQHVEVDLNLGDAADSYEHFDRILQQFERFCVVTESVRAGIDVSVAVRDAGGNVVHRSGGVA